LGVSIHEEKASRKKWGTLQIGNWKDDGWPPEQIIQCYGPATWAGHVFWGYWTLIYTFNPIIWLQEVAEIIINETVRSLFFFNLFIYNF
jgi:hypothetical protein